MKYRLVLYLIVMLFPIISMGASFPIYKAHLRYDYNEHNQVVRAIGDLQLDIERVTGVKPEVSNRKIKGVEIVVGTYEHSSLIRKLIKQGHLNEDDLKDKWESYVITTTKEKEPRLVIAGSDVRGTIYGIYDVSKRIGVSPWYWWGDVPIIKNSKVSIDCNYYSSGEPSVKYRGIFINDEDWGLKPWAARNFEKELGDIGPKTYAKVCELLLRLKANMLAPAMHSCTGAFYSHPESKVICDSYGIIITTSHCEPLLLNNAAKSEWDQERDGDWNYKTNRETILRKWDNRLKEASMYENIYTVAMRGLHDAGLRGNLPMEERVLLIDTVISHQRQLLENHIRKSAEDIPQIFVPYKETMDIYENGLRVPDDITLVWVDDNYGYLKRVSNPEEQKRSGGSGVYYHISYLGGPHDYLWLNTTPPVLMYEELKKAYGTGADRYWLLNVGDIKPMELGIQTFMDLAWNIDEFDMESVNQHQAKMLASLFGEQHVSEFQSLLDDYYRLAWSRKPEFMGFEYEWDDEEHTGLKPTEFSYQNYNDAQQRLADYRRMSDWVECMSDGSAAYYQLVQFPIQAAYQMNRKFLMAQLNGEQFKLGRLAQANWAARQMEIAYDSINTLNRRYNELLNGKWNGMMTLPPGWCALYHKKPEVIYTEGVGERAIDLSPVFKPLEGCYVLDLSNYIQKSDDIRLIHGLGYDWQVVQMDGGDITYSFPAVNSDTIEVTLYTVPFWPLYQGKGTRLEVSVDGSASHVFNNTFKEHSRTWKDQVIRNGALCKMRFVVDSSKSSHTIRFNTGDKGQMIQRVIIDWGGLKKSYVGPSLHFFDDYQNASEEIVFGTDLDAHKQMIESKEIANTAKIKTLQTWEKGRDKRCSYLFEELGEEMPFRVCVPQNWNGKDKLPLVMFLHGGWNDENSYLDQHDKQLVKLADKHGYILVSPLGAYSSYGNFLRLPAEFGNEEAAKDLLAETKEQLMKAQKLSEKDVINVLEIILKNYPVDRDCMFLCGHSMGSGGTWYIGTKYDTYWKALAMMSGPFTLREGYPWKKMLDKPMFISEGSRAHASLQSSRDLRDFASEVGLNYLYKEVDGDHEQMVPMVLPDIFEYFNQFLN